MNPRHGDRILVVTRQWLDLLLTQEKTLEVRGSRIRAGTYYLGCQQKMYARIRLGSAFEIMCDKTWRRMKQQHHVGLERRPYKRTFGLPVHAVEPLDQPVEYRHPRGAIGIVVYRG